MTSSFFTAQEQIPPGLGFPLFGRAHLLWLAAIGVCILAGALRIRRADSEKRRRIEILLCACTLALWLLWEAVLLLTGQFRLNYFPLDLCDIAVFAELWCAVRPGPVRQELCYCLFLPGALMALLFPNWTPLPLLNLQCIRGFAVHGLLTAYPILLLASGTFRPDPRRLPRCLCAALAMCVPVYWADQALDQNFFFLNDPSPGSPLELFAAWLGEPGYLIGLPIMLFLAWGVLYLPWLLLSTPRRIDSG